MGPVHMILIVQVNAEDMLQLMIVACAMVAIKIWIAPATCNGDAVEDCLGVCQGSAELDVCGVCEGGETDLNNCFENNTLTLSSSSINAGESTSIDVGLFNVDPVYGFQMDIQDWPDYGDFSSDVLPSDRCGDMTVSANIQPDGTLRIIWV